MMRISKNHRPFCLIGALVTIIAATLACNAPTSPTPSPELFLTLTRLYTPQSSPTPPPPSPTVTHTPFPDVSGPGGCTLNAGFIEDVTIPDNSELAPGKSFTKVWRMRNTGTCTWDKGTQLVFVSGELMDDSRTVEIPSVAPDAETDVSVEMVAPTTPGTYRSTWQLQSPDGTSFGTQVYVQIVVPAPATRTPTPTRKPTQQSTEESGLPDLTITSLEIDTNDPHQGIPLYIVATFRNQGDEAAEDFYWAWRSCVDNDDDDCEYIEAPDPLTLEPGAEVVAEMEHTFDSSADHITEALVDSREEIEESDETNNARQLAISVGPRIADLVVSAIAFDPDPPIQHQETIVELTVRNRGSKPAGAFEVQWSGRVDLPNPSCKWTVDSGLAAGGKLVLDCAFTYSDWYDKIMTRAIVDADGSVSELDETNNSLDRETQVKQP
jgi:hypothetical protein